MSDPEEILEDHKGFTIQEIVVELRAAAETHPRWAIYGRATIGDTYTMYARLSESDLSVTFSATRKHITGEIKSIEMPILPLVGWKLFTPKMKETEKA